MRKLTFRGGIHPDDGKSITMNLPIKVVQAGKELVYPLSQHIGARAKPLVEKGDRVLRGQKIAEAEGFVSAPIHASVSGMVKGLEDRRVATGELVKSIIVENDGLNEETTFCTYQENTTKEEIRAIVREAGIVGMGGAGFPAAVKLSPKEPAQIEYVIANCAECEPYLTSDYRRMIEEPERIVNGLRTVLRLFDKAMGLLVVEDNKPEGIAALRKVVRGERRILVKSVKTKYPQGAERQLIYAVTGRKISSAHLPADVGCIVHNADTLTAIGRAVSEGRPLTDRVVTVTGDAIANPGNYLVPIGTSFQDLLDAVGGFRKEPQKMICGGPMMGFAMFDTKIPITKTATALLAFEKDVVSETVEEPCINCGRCLDVCPGRIMPCKLADCAQHGDAEQFHALFGMECCECGCCSYICPAKRPLTQWIKSMRKSELAKRKK
ncbi:MAG: electron transport complex subunit RsxC [Lachnospiraceae bacterium]|jgi:electron transport complex protein RnfC|nr:electron transport complex subunit RsxC [Lachnospiraceae bacterium]